MTHNSGEEWVRISRLPHSTHLSKNLPDQTALNFLQDEAVPPQEGGNTASNRERDDLINWEPQPDTPGPGAAQTPPLSNSTVLRIGLAIADDGTWAAFIDDALYCGDVNGIRTVAPISAIGIVFNHLGVLWATTKDALISFRQPARTVRDQRKWPLREAGIPARSTDGKTLFVPSSQGLLTLAYKTASKEKNSLPSIEWWRLGAIDAIGAMVQTAGVIVANRGTIWRTSSKGNVDAIFPVPPSRVVRVVIDRSERVIIRTENNGWLEKQGRSWHPLQVRDMAVDAHGRLWQGTHRGPSGPHTAKLTPTHFDTSMHVVDPIARILDRNFGFPGPPPCSRILFTPLPRTRLFFSWGRGSVQRIVGDQTIASAGGMVSVYIGIQLTWSIDPIVHPPCHAQQSKWQQLKDQRLNQVTGLWRDWQHLCRSSTQVLTPYERAVLETKKNRIAELIHIATGIDPRKEEQ